MTTPNVNKLGIDPGTLEAICSSFGLQRLAAFGSLARGDGHADSDVDLLYELRPGRAMGLLTLGELADALGALFNGRRVDLAREGQLHWYIRDRIIREARVLYEG